MIVKDVEIGLTTRCNLGKCAFCFRANCDNEIPNIDLYIDVAKRAFTKSFMKNLNTLVICGNMGDPMFYPHLFEFIDHTAELAPENMVVCMDTNGSARPKSWWKSLAQHMNKYKQYHVRFAIDGLEDTHKLYRIGSDFKTVISNMETFIEAGGRATWKFIVFKHNEHQIDKAYEMAKQLGCCTFTVVASGIHNDDLKMPEHYKMKTSKGILCKSQDMNHISIDADGEVMPCCYFRPFKNNLRGEKIYWDDIMLMLKYVQSKQYINIKYNTIERAIDSKFFHYLYSNYKGINICQNFCGENRRRPDNVIVRRDYFYNLDGTKSRTKK